MNTHFILPPKIKDNNWVEVTLKLKLMWPLDLMPDFIEIPKMQGGSFFKKHTLPSISSIFSMNIFQKTIIIMFN